MRLSLVIPCYNEAKNLPLLAARVRGAMASSDAEIILVDNGSKDDLPAVLAGLVDDKLIRTVRVDVNQGYGFGILSGLRAARGDILGWTHADMQTDPADALRGLKLFDAAPDPKRLYVKGLRHGRPLSDTVFTAGMTVFETALLGAPLRDINAQPNLFHRAFYDTWQNPPHDFALDLFVYHQAKAQGLSVERFPVVFAQRAHGISSWNISPQAKWRFIKRTLDFSFRLRFAERGELGHADHRASAKPDRGA